MWPGITETERDAICNLPELPADLGLLDSPEQTYYFWYFVWANLDGNGQQWSQLTCLAYFLHLRTIANHDDELLAFAVDPVNLGQWPPALFERLARVSGLAGKDQPDEDTSDLLTEIHAHAVSLLQDWYWAFGDEVRRILHWGDRVATLDEWKNAGPTALAGTSMKPTFGLESIDRDYCDRLSQVNLKEMAPGASAEFMIVDDILLIGDGFPPSYQRLVAMNGRTSRLKVRSRGGRFRPGTLEVKLSRHTELQPSFSQALSRFSRKRIVFM